MSDAQANSITQWLASISAALGTFHLGLLLGWSNIVQKEIEAGRYGFPCSEKEFSWISSCFLLGAMLMCIPMEYIVNFFGRKWPMVFMCIPLIGGWVLIIIAGSPKCMCFGRFLLGIGSGAFTVAVPIFVCEIAHRSVRGHLSTLFQFNVVLGIQVVWVLGVFVNAFHLCIICSVPPALIAVLMPFMRETPTYLVKVGNMEAAAESLAWYRGKDYNINGEMSDIINADAKEKANPVSLHCAFKRPGVTRAFVIIIMLMILQEFSGINVIIFYSTKIFRSINIQLLSPEMATVSLGAIRIILTFAALFVVNVMRRRTLLLISGGGMASLAFTLSTLYFMKETNPSKIESLALISFASIYLYVLIFSFGYGPVPWLILGELFPMNIKEPISSYASTMNWLGAFIITKLFPTFRDLLGPAATFMVLGGILTAGQIYIYFFVIETKGKSISEIQVELEELSSKKRR